MAKFLDQETLYRVIQRELPEDVYPDAGSPSAYWSTSDSASQAAVLATVTTVPGSSAQVTGAYAAMEQAYDNFFPQTADDEGISLHELARFGALAQQPISEADRVARILKKMQSLDSMSVPDMTAIAEEELPPFTFVQIVAWSSIADGWVIGESELGVSTILNAFGVELIPAGGDFCDSDGSQFGLTPTQWLEVQQAAYTYEVRIFNYTPTALESTNLEAALLEAEPARSQHIVLTNQPLSNIANPFLPVFSQ